MSRQSLVWSLLAAMAGLAASRADAQVPNGDFETGPFDTLTSWTTTGRAFIQGKPDEQGLFANPEGAHFASSWRPPGHADEGSTGTLRSADFTLAKTRLSFLATGWQGARPCYVALCLAADGRELGRSPAPNTGAVFVRRWLDVDPQFLNQKVYIQVVDDNPATVASGGGFQYIAVDDFKLEYGPGVAQPLPVFDPAKSIVLENARYRVEANRSNGGISTIVDKQGALDLYRPLEAADNFKLVLEGGRTILGKKQPLDAADLIGTTLTLHWRGPLRDTRGDTHPLEVALHVVLTGQAVQFGVTVTNHDPARLAEVAYPLIGGDLVSRNERPLGPWSLAAPDETVALPGEYHAAYPSWPSLSMPWVDFASTQRGRGFYYADLDPLCRYKGFHLDGSLPRPEGYQALGQFWWTHNPYTRTGHTYEGPPVVLRAHDGDWRQAAPLYRSWFEATFGKIDMEKSWLRHLPVYQDVMFMLPEGNVEMRFSDIPRYAADGLKYGIKAIMISGWNVGGHDGWYPFYRPDPRLGTWEDLEAVLKEVHHMGVKVIFFVNFNWVTPKTKWFEDELSKYFVGNAGGWGMGTIGARRAWTTTNLGVDSPAYPEFRRIIVDQMRRLAQAGADGLHFDKTGYGDGLNPSTKLPEGIDADAAESTELLKGFDEVARACREVNPDFSFSFESNWDRLLPFSAGCKWWGSVGDGMLKATFPEFAGQTSAVQPYDNAIVNDCVMQGIHCMIGAKCYTASIGDKAYAPLGAYVKEVIKIWEAQLDTIFLGEPVREGGLQVTSPTMPSKTYRNPQTKKRAAVVVNQQMTTKTLTIAGFPNQADARLTLYQPYQPVRAVKTPVEIVIPGEQLAVIAETGTAGATASCP